MPDGLHLANNFRCDLDCHDCESALRSNLPEEMKELYKAEIRSMVEHAESEECQGQYRYRYSIDEIEYFECLCPRCSRFSGSKKSHQKIFQKYLDRLNENERILWRKESYAT